MHPSYASFLRELEKLDKKAAEAFLEAVRGMTDTRQIEKLDAAILARRFDEVFEILRIDESQWAPLVWQIEAAYLAGAVWGLAQIPKPPAGINLRLGFNHRNPRAEAWNFKRGSDFVTEMLEDQRAAIRNVIQSGLEQGKGVTAMRKALIGVRVGGKRQGGIVGLHSRDAGAVERMRAYLSNPDTMSEYFSRSARDRRFDGIIRKAMRQGRKLTQAEIDKITGRYAERLLIKRSDRVARTEMHNAFANGRAEAMQQVIEENGIPEDAVTKTWQATIASARTRDTHRALHGQKVKFNRPFVSFSLAQMNHPGDSSLGAGPEEIVNCRCSCVYRIDYSRMR